MKQTMAKMTRLAHSAVFKAQMALAAMSGDKILAELAQRFDVHPNLIMEWKRQLSESRLTRGAGGSARAIGSDRHDLSHPYHFMLEVSWLGT